MLLINNIKSLFDLRFNAKSIIIGYSSVVPDNGKNMSCIYINNLLSTSLSENEFLLDQIISVNFHRTKIDLYNY